MYKFYSLHLKHHFSHKSRQINPIIWLSILLFFGACAKIGMPSGGKKDIAPPKLVRCIPPNNSTNFHGNKITITFDELVDLDNVSQNLLISPPMAKMPKVVADGKSVKILFDKNQLRDTTTYSFFFGKSIKDYNEGNALPPFTYAFSTGKTIDSLRISGMVSDVTNGKPMDDTYVVLYTNLNDSAPKKELPIFITKTRKDGSFEIRNIKKIKYKIYALKDANNDLKFNQPTEAFAFNDSIIIPSIKLTSHSDTVKCPSKDSLSKKKVTLKKGEKPCRDTIIVKTDTIYSPNKIQLKCFVEEKKTQYLANASRAKKERIVLSFNMPIIKDSLIIEPLKTTIQPKQILKEFSAKKDTLYYWLIDQSLRNNDSLQLVVHFFKHDTAGVIKWLTDTVKPRYDARKDKLKGHQVCTITCSTKNNSDLDLSGNLTWNVSTPIVAIDKSKIVLNQAIDTSSIKNTNGEFYQIDTNKTEIYTQFSIPRKKNYVPKFPVLQQSISKYQSSKNKFLLAFDKPLLENDSIFVKLENRKQSSWLLTERDVASNSLFCWITDKALLTRKSFTFTVLFNDSTIDTLLFERPRINLPTSGGDELVIPPLQLNGLILDEMIPVFMINPIDSFDIKGFSLIKTGDTAKKEFPITFKRINAYPRTLFICASNLKKSQSYSLTINEHALTDIRGTFNQDQTFAIKTQMPQRNFIVTPETTVTIKTDSINKHKQIATAKWIEKKKYQLNILPGAYTDVYGNTNDSLLVTFSIPSKDSYGSLLLTMKSIAKVPVIIQFCDKDEKVLIEKYAAKDTIIALNFIKTGEYKLKAIYDKNGNKKWDTGTYLEANQAERIQNYIGSVSIKSGWENKLEWNLTEEPKPEVKTTTPPNQKTTDTKAK